MFDTILDMWNFIALFFVTVAPYVLIVIIIATAIFVGHAIRQIRIEDRARAACRERGDYEYDWSTHGVSDEFFRNHKTRSTK